jgi:hypothetical protein
LWLGYGKSNDYTSMLFDRTSSLWENATFLVFDLPLSRSQTYSQRIQAIEASLPNHPFLKFVKPIECTGKAHMMEILSQCVSRGSPGIMLRKPNALYMETNSTFQALNVTHIKALVKPDGSVEDLQGKKFEINSIGVNLKPGMVVQLGIEAGKAKTLQIRPDLSWTDVLKDQYPYFVGLGRTSLSTCRGCLKRIPSDEPRIKTLCRYTTKDQIVPAYISFCLETACLQKGLKRYNSKTVAPFHGDVWVDTKFERIQSIAIIPKFEIESLVQSC